METSDRTTLSINIKVHVKDIIKNNLKEKRSHRRTYMYIIIVFIFDYYLDVNKINIQDFNFRQDKSKKERLLVLSSRRSF